MMLKADSLHLSFGGVLSLNNLSFELGQKEILALIGPNGAGKTSVLNCISGFYKPQEGQIIFDNYDLVKMPPDKIAHLGLARTFQHIELYAGLSTLDNLMSARHIHMKYNPFWGMFYPKRVKNEEKEHRKVVEEIIDLLDLQPIRYSIVGMLPYGLRKRVDLGRALALEPKVLLLDEPMAGMNMEEKEDMARFILDIFELREIPIILVEHDMGVIMDLADRIVVLDFGVKIAEGTPETIGSNEKVARVYLKSEELSADE
jgi:branched-chain amino acid transport system ATP-binding protein